MFPGWRYFSYFLSVKYDLSTISPVHCVFTFTSSPFPFSAIEPGSLTESVNGILNHDSLIPLSSESIIKPHSPASETDLLIFFTCVVQPVSIRIRIRIFFIASSYKFMLDLLKRFPFCLGQFKKYKEKSGDTYCAIKPECSGCFKQAV